MLGTQETAVGLVTLPLDSRIPCWRGLWGTVWLEREGVTEAAGVTNQVYRISLSHKFQKFFLQSFLKMLLITL